MNVIELNDEINFLMPKQIEPDTFAILSGERK